MYQRWELRRRWPASDGRRRWKILIGQFDRFGAIEVDIDEPAGWLAKDQSDVIFRREMLLDVIDIDADIRPVIADW